jgi:outer membrane protein
MQIRALWFFLISAIWVYAGDYSLAKLCEKGLKNDPKIRGMKHRGAASHSYYNQSIDQYKPHFNISGQYGMQNYDLGLTNYKGSSYNYQFTLKQPLYRAKLLEAIKDASAREVLSKLQTEDEKARLITQILQVSIELTRQRKEIDVLEKKVKLLDKAYENIKKKHRVKLVSGADAFQSQAMLQQAKSELIRAKQAYDYNLYNLRLLTKYKDVEKYIKTLRFNVNGVEKAFRKANLAQIKREIENNTRIKLDTQSVKIAKLQMGLRNSERAPDFDAVLSYGDAGGTLDYATRQNESKAMLTLNFPIYQGGYVDDRVEEAKYLYMAAREDADNSLLNIKISLEKALENIKSGIESTKAQKVAVSASKKYFDGTIQSYKNGVASLTDAYLAEADYRDNQLKLIQSEANIFTSLAELYYYIGRTDYKDIKKMQEKFLK